MMLLALAILPGLLWDQPVDTAPALKKAGITAIAVPSERAKEWASTDIRATAVDVSQWKKLSTPNVDYQLGRSGATGAPWINSNLWEIARTPSATFVYDVPRNAVALAMAEAYASGAKAYLRVKPDAIDDYAAMLKFLIALEPRALPARANIAVVDDGSEEIPEVLNLLSR